MEYVYIAATAYLAGMFTLIFFALLAESRVQKKLEKDILNEDDNVYMINFRPYQK